MKRAARPSLLETVTLAPHSCQAVRKLSNFSSSSASHTSLSSFQSHMPPARHHHYHHHHHRHHDHSTRLIEFCPLFAPSRADPARPVARHHSATSDWEPSAVPIIGFGRLCASSSPSEPLPLECLLPDAESVHASAISISRGELVEIEAHARHMKLAGMRKRGGGGRRASSQVAARAQLPPGVNLTLERAFSGWARVHFHNRSPNQRAPARRHTLVRGGGVRVKGRPACRRHRAFVSLLANIILF